VSDDTDEFFDKKKFKEIAAHWDHAHRYSPGPRHRRKIILNMLKELHFSDCIDTGCAQPYLLQEIKRRFQVKGYGCDISTTVIKENKEKAPDCEFKVLDLEKEKWPNDRQFDLVISSEVIEHIADWEAAVKNIASMAKRYLLITVPSGKIRKIDRTVGHYRHYLGNELISHIENQGFRCLRSFHHGFPMHSLYKRLINNFAPDKIYASFQGGGEYTFLQKMFSQIIYITFYLNYLFSKGTQLFVLAERQNNE